MPPSIGKKNTVDFRKDIFAILFLAMGIFFGLCLVSYNPMDPSLNSVSTISTVKNFGGIIGAYIAPP